MAIKSKQKNQDQGTKKYKHNKAVKISLLSVLVVVAFLLIAIAGYSISYAQKTYINLYLGGKNYGGMSKNQVVDDLTSRSQDFLKNNFSLVYSSEDSGDKSYQVPPNDLGLVFDINKSATGVFGYGRDRGAFKNFILQVKSFLKPVELEAAYTINEDALSKKISEIALEIDIPEKDYEINYAGDGNFTLLDDKQTGKRIDQDYLMEAIKSQISKIKAKETRFSANTYEPRVLHEKAKDRLKSANQILNQGALNLVYSDLSFSFDVDTIGGLIRSRPKDDDLELFLDRNKALTQIDALAQTLNRDPKNAILQAKDGKVSAFQLSQEGRELDRENSLIDIGNALLARATKGVKEIDTLTVVLKVKTTLPEVTSDKLESYGLKELVASGTTNFKGSPTNRVHNITVGANAINGTLIKPGEIFSTLEKLGEIDASGGYLPELVIKENRTVPEYGGGLCQVSTTLFRAALNSGMEILARSNHKYRVSYYEPPVGMDATIYDPAPDFKFKNNYDSYILIQANVVGTKITFDFYGTKDSRIVEIGTPEVYDFVDPGPAIEVTSDTLAPGERKQLEKAHQGASAKFHYKVAKDGNILQEKDFFSKYVAWPERWLVGITQEVAPAPETPPADPVATPPA